MVRTIRLISTHTDRYIAALKGKFLDTTAYDELIVGEDVDVLKPDGSPLLLLRHNVLPAGVCKKAYPALIHAAKPTDNRGTAAGGRYHKIKKDGTVSRTNRAKNVLSGIIGYMDRYPRIPYCRATAFRMDEAAKWASVLPFIRAVNEVFKTELPDRYEAQMRMVRKTEKDFTIHGTAFTTITVNRNFQTAVHKDEGDLREGFGVMSVLRAGEYDGAYLVFPKFRVAVDLHSRDVLLADVHQWHGNTPFAGIEGTYERIMTVSYYRSKMRECGTPAEELARAKNR